MKNLTCFRMLLLLLLTLPAVVQAQFDYTDNGDGMITITGYTGPGGAVVIPATINGLPVTVIGDYAFNDQSDVARVTIPNTVTSIGTWAFGQCIGLTSVRIGDSVTSIGYGAFGGCTMLTSITIPNRVATIGDLTFDSCTSLTSVTIGDSVTSIGYGAFGGCTSLTNVTIPNSVTDIGAGAFYHCTSLRTITVDALNTFYSSVDGVVFNKSQTVLVQFPAGKAGSYIIPNSVTSIEGSAFASCTGLTNVMIGDSLTSIGYNAFGGCTSLTSVTIPNSVTCIGDVAFESCTSLTSVTIGNSVTNIGYLAFQLCISLSAITVDALNSAFSSVDGVLFNKSQTVLIAYPGGKAGTYTVPNSVTSIGAGAFVACYSLTSVTIANSVTNIGDYAFGACYSLTGVYFQGNAPSVGVNNLFFVDNVTVYYLPGTTGWEETFAGRPAVLWNPLVQTADASFGVRTNRFGFTITGASNLVLVVEAATNLANPVWVSVSTNTLTGGASYFSDPEWTNHPARFYRLRSP